jgi:hypothetical protein
MSNRRKRQARRHHMTPAQRWAADRYRPHRQYTAAQVRQILVDDGVNRRSTPLTWLVHGVTYIAAKERRTKEAVFVEIEQACIAGCGLPLPKSGDMSTL